MHYGKISEYFFNEQNWKDRAEWDGYEKGDNYEAVLNHHRLSNSENTLELEPVKKEWFWE